MTLYDSPRDVTAHLHQLEVNLGASGYDHSRPPAKGWRAERQIVEMASLRTGSQQSSCAEPSGMQRILGWLMSRHIAKSHT
jgi:hypothetical protein